VMEVREAANEPAETVTATVTAESGSLAAQLSLQPSESAGAAGPKKPSKAQRKKATKAAKEKARRDEIAHELKDVVDPRAVENEQLAKRLSPLNLTVKEIRSDGHCLYRALEDQLSAEKHAIGQPVFMTLRKYAADYMSKNPDEFKSFMTNDDGDEMSPAEYKQYCAAITAAEPVAWGGHQEIVALSKALKRRIVVHSSDNSMPVGTASDDTLVDLHITYHKHYYGLGEHYNSAISTRKKT